MVSQSECSRLNAGCLSSKSQDFVSSGIPSLDTILNNGLPLGALILLEEDDLQFYSDIITKYFLAEGIANNDYIFLGNRDNDPLATIEDLPVPVPVKDEVLNIPKEELKIAWRYQSNSVVQSSPSTSRTLFSHDFDFGSKLPEKTLKTADFTLWPQKSRDSISLFDEICCTISAKNLWCGHEVKYPEKKILRICIKSIGSPYWGESVSVTHTLLQLRTLIHNSSSVAIVTLPTHILDKKTVIRCEQMSDIVISLDSLINSTNKQYMEYNGLMKFVKISPLNSLCFQVPDDSVWAFKHKKNKLIIEKLHLPPESSVTNQREQDDISSAPKLTCQIQF